MPVILLKKSDTPAAVPSGTDLTNLAGGVEVAVNVGAPEQQVGHREHV